MPAVIKCRNCANTNANDLVFTKDDNYIICKACGAITDLHSDKMVTSIKIDGVLTKEERYENAAILLKMRSFDTAESSYKQLCMDYPTDYRSWYGRARAVSKHFTCNYELAGDDMEQAKDCELDTYAKKEIVSIIDTLNSKKQRLEDKKKLDEDLIVIEQELGKLQCDKIACLEKQNQVKNNQSYSEQKSRSSYRAYDNLTLKRKRMILGRVLLIILGILVFALGIIGPWYVLEQPNIQHILQKMIGIDLRIILLIFLVICVTLSIIIFLKPSDRFIDRFSTVKNEEQRLKKEVASYDAEIKKYNEDLNELEKELKKLKKDIQSKENESGKKKDEARKIADFLAEEIFFDDDECYYEHDNIGDFYPFAYRESASPFTYQPLRARRRF